MRVLILGGSGMLGHKLWQVFSKRFDTYVTLRKNAAIFTRFGLFDPERVIAGVDAFNLDTVEHAINSLMPEVVINGIGIIKQAPESQDPITTLTSNSLFPHHLSRLSNASKARLIHISTDCVFSGKKGNYTESDPSDAEDFYGRSKFLGEVSGDGCLTIRTSVIGRELGTTHGLVEWFLSSRGGRVPGYTKAIYTGFPTVVLAHILADLIDNHPRLSGLFHVSSNPISKYELLQLMRSRYGTSIEIDAFDGMSCDRSLDSTRFRRETGFTPIPWPQMINAMAEDHTPYDQ